VFSVLSIKGFNHIIKRAVKGYDFSMSVRAIRGAIQVEANSTEAISAGTKELLSEILRANSLAVDQVISVILTATPDLNAAFPAAAAREVGFEATPLLCAVEIDVLGALARVVRAMVTVETHLAANEISHIYLAGAKALRRDIAQ
jgi:chorismate mutase